MENPAEAAVAIDLANARFRSGSRRGFWRLVEYSFPYLTMAVAATEPDESSSEYFFRFELSGYRGTAPEVRIWDQAHSTLLPFERRPKGPERVVHGFKQWGHETVYRPWDRLAGPHNNWPRDHQDLIWNASRDLAFILEDVHEILNLNARARSIRASA